MLRAVIIVDFHVVRVVDMAEGSSSRTEMMRASTTTLLREFKKAQVPPRLRKRPSGTLMLDETILEDQYSLRRSVAVFIGVLGMSLAALFTCLVLFHERRGIASTRAWWLALTLSNAALLLYALWAWVTEEVKGRPADSWLGSALGTYLWGVTRGDDLPEPKIPSPTLPKRPFYPMPPDAWHCPWGPCVVVCACYLYRSLWQHCTVERYCMAVWPRGASPVLEPLLSPLMGRFVASVGEYVFVTRCMLPNALWGRDRWLKTPLTWLVALAELVSDVGVIKRHYGFFAVENSLWALLFAAVFMSTLRSQWVAYSHHDRTERPSILVACRMLALVLAFILVAYNSLEDVPMYYRQYVQTVVEGQADPSSPAYGRYDLPFRDGLVHGLHCHRLMPVDDEGWRPFMVWMSLNYLALPLWMVAICAITARHAVVGFNEKAGGHRTACP